MNFVAYISKSLCVRLERNLPSIPSPPPPCGSFGQS